MSTAIPKALAAFFGARARTRTAETSTNVETVKALIGSGQDRPQEIYTPAPILTAIRKLWPEGIALDPCGGPDSIVLAEETWYGEQVETGRTRKDGTPATEWRAVRADQDGPHSQWRGRTYANPPYKHLQDYLEHAQNEHARGVDEIIILGPTRLHRTWARAAAIDCSAMVFLNPVTFGGYSSSFPEPLALWYWGLAPAQLDAICREAGLGQRLCR